MTNNKKIFFGGLFIFALCFLFLNFAQAENLADALSKVNNNIGPETGIVQTDITILVARIIKAVFSVSGIIFFALMIYAGLNWMIARGEEEKVSESKKILTTSVIGIVIIISAYAVTNLIQSRIIETKMLNGGLNSETTQEESKIGCCVDWVSSTGVAEGNWIGAAIPASRITTFNDCKTWGEKEGQGDIWYCEGPKEGCWMFTEGITDINVCNQIRQNYVKN